MKYAPPSLPLSEAERREIRGVTIELVARSLIEILVLTLIRLLVDAVVWRDTNPRVGVFWAAFVCMYVGWNGGRRVQAERTRIWMRRVNHTP